MLGCVGHLTGDHLASTKAFVSRVHVQDAEGAGGQEKISDFYEEVVPGLTD